MALIITSGFPRDLPLRDDGLLPFEAATFDPYYQNTMAPTRGGGIQVANIGTELWQINFKSHVMGHGEALEYHAWLHSLRGGARLFKAWHPHLAYPVAYPGGFGGMNRGTGGSFDGTCTISAIGAQRDTLTITTLPNAFSIRMGDMVSFVMGASRTLHRIMAPVTASGVGTAVVTVEPTIPLAAVSGVEGTFVKPWCLAVVDAKSLKGPWQPNQFGSVEFSATQTF